MISEPSKFDLKNISMLAPRVRTKATMAQNRAYNGLEGANSVGKGQDSTQPTKGATNAPQTQEKPYQPKLALEVPSIELGGGMRTAPVRFELSPVAQTQADSSQQPR